MKKLAVYYYKNGYNCSQCILKAVSEKLNISISKQCFNMCSAVNNGFGIRSTCSVLVACIMSIGLLFNEQTAKRLRMKFLNKFNSIHGSLNCAHLKNQNETNCENIIGDAADLLEKLVAEER